MNDVQPPEGEPPLSPALAAAIAITAATGIPPIEVTQEELLGGVDPMLVVRVLGLMLHSALGTVLGEDGRADILRYMGLDAARRMP